jgi:hypothetical protein
LLSPLRGHALPSQTDVTVHHGDVTESFDPFWCRSRQPLNLRHRRPTNDQDTPHVREQTMLAEVFMLRLEAAARASRNGSTSRDTRFVPVVLKTTESK